MDTTHHPDSSIHKLIPELQFEAVAQSETSQTSDIDIESDLQQEKLGTRPVVVPTEALTDFFHWDGS